MCIVLPGGSKGLGVNYPKALKTACFIGVSLLTMGLCSPTPSQPASYNQQWSSLPAALGWAPSKNNLCKGKYIQAPIVSKIPRPEDFSKLPTKVTAQGPTVLRNDGTSVLHRHVVISQPGRLSTSDIGQIHRNAKTGKVSGIDLKGHVKIEEYQKQLLGSHAHLNLTTRAATVNDAIYQITGKTPSGEDYDAWGTAAIANRESDGVLILQHATFTTCSPLNPSWQLSASKLTLNNKKKRATARNAVIKFKNVPIFYAPYYSFSLNHDRKTGFLTPVVGFSNKNGLNLSLPYYINLAPNYDLTITPEIITKRGVMTSSLFRYLSESSIGGIHGSFLPGDRKYKSFLKDNDLTGNDNRWLFNYNDHTNFNNGWSVDITANQVSDSYYFQDFSDNENLVVANQLLSQADTNYHGDHWQFSGMVQGYQTLHPSKTNPNFIVQDQYQRLPEFDWNGQYPNILGPTNFAVDAQFINFGFPHAAENDKAIGQRYHIRPNITLPFSNSYAYFNPSLYLDFTQYDVHPNQAGIKRNISRTLPIATINSGLYLDRAFHINHTALTQTLEPQFQYLNVPYTNQNNLPVFDTILLPFTYPQLFAVNQYSGFDRIQNANQLSTGLTSRIIDSTNGNQLFAASIGEIFYFDRRKVQLPDLNEQKGSYSPIIAQLTANPTPHWGITWNFAWDPVIRHTNNNGIDLNYHGDGNRLFDLGYDFVYQDGTGYNPLNRIRVGSAWPLTSRISALGYLYYNLSNNYPDSYFVGLQYDTCCWAIRGLVSRNEFNNTGVKGLNPRTTYYLQFQLKGLANVGNSDPSSLILQSLPNYQNIFKSS